MRKIKDFIWDFLRLVGLGGFVQIAMRSPMLDDGWFKSYNQKKSIDKQGNPIPWCTYPFLKFIEPRLNKEMEIFEFGAGNSTIWYGSRVKSVTSVEHDEKWIDIVKSRLPKNATLTYRPVENSQLYAKEVKALNKKFDMVIVDGQDRNNCMIHSAEAVTERGVIILDNSEREEYLPGINFLHSQGYKKIDFWGLSPIISTYNCTTIFYKGNNCLGI